MCKGPSMHLCTKHLFKRSVHKTLGHEYFSKEIHNNRILERPRKTSLQYLYQKRPLPVCLIQSCQHLYVHVIVTYNLVF
jgi:hypothetical protein